MVPLEQSLADDRAGGGDPLDLAARHQLRARV